MTRASVFQGAFNAGEISSLLVARDDLSSYAAAVFTCRNFLPLPQGALTRRPGTLFLGSVKYPYRQTVLIPYSFSTTQSYIIEAGHQYFRFFSSGGLVASSQVTITAISQANPAVVTYIGTDPVNDQRVVVKDVQGMTQVNGREFVVKNVNTTAKTFQLYEDITGTAVPVNSTGYDAYSSGGIAFTPLEVVTPYADTQLLLLRWTQSVDTLYLFHPAVQVQKLKRLSPTSFSLSAASFVDGPYDAQNLTSTTLTPSATTGSITITASSTTGINENSGFATTDIGRLVRIQHSSTWGYAEITGVVSATQVNAVVKSAFGATTASSAWRLGIWCPRTGFPANGTFFENRLCLSGTPAFPQRVDLSKSANYEDFSPSSTGGVVAADNAVAAVLNSDRVNVVRWLVADERGLLVGTSGAEWVIRAASLTEALSPTNVIARPISRYGSQAIEPAPTGKVSFFVQAGGLIVRELSYAFDIDGFRAVDVSLLAEHLMRPGIVQAAFQLHPLQIVWFRRADGVLLGLTYERDRGVIGWHQHELGGSSSSDGTLIAVVESIAVGPDPDGSGEALTMIVRRHINGATRRYVEVLTDIWDVDRDQTTAFYVDAGTTRLLSPASNALTGLWHLEGQTVSILGNGAVFPDAVVNNGKVTLPTAVSVAQIGLPAPSEMITLPPAASTQDGSLQTKARRAHRVGIWMVDTLGLKYGPLGGSLTEVLVRRFLDPYLTATPLFTGVFRGRLEADYSRIGQLVLQADTPLPATIVGISQQLDSYDAT